MSAFSIMKVGGFTWLNQDDDWKAQGAVEPIWNLIWPMDRTLILINYGNYGRGKSRYEGTQLISGPRSLGPFESILEAVNSRELQSYLQQLLIKRLSFLQEEVESVRLYIDEIRKASDGSKGLFI